MKLTNVSLNLARTRIGNISSQPEDSNPRLSNGFGLESRFVSSLDEIEAELASNSCTCNSSSISIFQSPSLERVPFPAKLGTDRLGPPAKGELRKLEIERRFPTDSNDVEGGSRV